MPGFKFISVCVGNTGKMCVKTQLSVVFSCDNRGTRKYSHNLIHWEVPGPQCDLGQNDSTTSSGKVTVWTAVRLSQGPALGQENKPSLGLLPEPRQAE